MTATTGRSFLFAVSWPDLTGRPALIEWVARDLEMAWAQVRHEFRNEPEVLIEHRQRH